MNANFLKATELCERKEYQQAIPFFDQSIRAQPSHAESFFNRGLAKFMLQDYQAALEDFDAAITLLPSEARIYSERAVTKHHLKDQRGALEDFNKALALEPGNPYRYSSRAYLRAFIGDTEGAIADYQEAIKLDPEDAIAYNNLGLLEEKLGRQSAAQVNFAKADAIADKGKTFEKPDLEQALADYEKRQAEQQEAERLRNQPKGTGENFNDTPENAKVGDYFRVMASVFSSKETFSEFWQFIRSGFTKKNN